MTIAKKEADRSDCDSMKNVSSYPTRPNEAILLVESYREGELSGWLIHPRIEFPKAIRSLPQFILDLKDLLSQGEGVIYYSPFEQSGNGKIPRIATLRINVLQQEQHTWQGRIQWEEQGKEETFQSVLELMRIMDEFLAE